MATSALQDGDDDIEIQWRTAVVEAQRAHSEYVEHLRTVADNDPIADQLWLRLWRAERRRDELFCATS